MSLISATGIHVRHAIARALATTNRAPGEGTWRLTGARVTLDARGRVAGAEVSLRVEAPRPAAPWHDDLLGLVNPDGEHPLMACVPGGDGLLMDVFPVTWERWSKLRPGERLPSGVDPACPRTGVDLASASAWARQAGKRLPDAAELRRAWGPGPWPWGPRPDVLLGLDAPPRFGGLPEVGVFPPNRAGFFDLGAWLWVWTAEGTTLGGLPGLVAGGGDAEPRGFRCVQDLSRADGARPPDPAAVPGSRTGP